MQEKSSNDAINKRHSNLIIDQIDADSSAENSGIIQTGDRIICVNGQLLEGFSLG
jgi:C-terminal processing protease CtpA/Prc